MISLTALGLLFSIFLIRGSQNEKNTPTPTQLYNICAQDIDCLSAGISDKMQSNGISSSFRYMQEVAGASGVPCHTLSHYVGGVMYKRVGSELLKSYEDICDGGFTHGWMGAMSSQIEINEQIAIFAKYCSGSSNATACQHGIGHALGENITKPEEVNNICSSTGEGLISNHPLKSVSGSCVEGWMMEYRGINYWNKDEAITAALNLCEELSIGLWVYCASEAHRRWSESSDAADLMRMSSFHSFCEKLSGENYTVCTMYLGEAISIIALGEGDIDSISQAANKYCISTRIGNSCMKNILYTFEAGWGGNPSNLDTFCSSLPDSYINPCRKGSSGF